MCVGLTIFYKSSGTFVVVCWFQSEWHCPCYCCELCIDSQKRFMSEFCYYQIFISLWINTRWYILFRSRIVYTIQVSIVTVTFILQNVYCISTIMWQTRICIHFTGTASERSCKWLVYDSNVHIQRPQSSWRRRAVNPLIDFEAFCM